MCLYVHADFFTTPSRMIDVATWRRNITQDSYLTAHISSMLEDTFIHTCTRTCLGPEIFFYFFLRRALKAVTLADSAEGVGMDRTRAGGSREWRRKKGERVRVCVCVKDREQGRGGR